MSTPQPMDYQVFLSSAYSSLLSEGGQVLLAPDHEPGQAAAWTAGWDQIFLLNNPGMSTLFAFTRVEDGAQDELQSRLSELASGLAGRGVATGAPVALVAIVAVATTEESRLYRGIARMKPSQYHAGLRPSTWVVNLTSRRVTGNAFRKPEGLELVERALSDSDAGPDGPSESVQIRHETSTRRLQDFYALMQGRQPVVTYGLICVNVVVYLLLYANGGPQSDVALRNFGALSPKLVQEGQWWRLVTSMFLHAGVTHILFNMTSLYAIGTLAERLYGSAKFLAIYLGAGLIGSIVSFGYAVASGNTDVLGVGASGAIFGVAGSLITVRFQKSAVIPLSVRRRVSSSMIPLAGISLLFAYFTPHVDNSAHIGGLLGGMALSFVFPLTREPVRSAP